MHISTSNLSATKSDDFTKIFQRIKKDEGTKCEETKRLVQAEVRNNDKFVNKIKSTQL